MSKIPFKRMLGVILSLFQTLLLAGEWVGAGGDFMQENRNPWFFESEIPMKAREIRYCIEMNRDHFSSTPEIADRLIKRAFSYWKNEFDSINSPVSSATIWLGTERFHKVNCDHNAIDIRFNFGNPSAEIILFLKEPSSYIAAAIRTHYDRKQLRGKGIVYLSPNAGTFAMKRPGIAANVWQKEGLLYGVILHEMGHIFGLQHPISSISHNPFMHEKFPLELVTSEGNDPFSTYNYSNLLSPAWNQSFFNSEIFADETGLNLQKCLYAISDANLILFDPNNTIDPNDDLITIGDDSNSNTLDTNSVTTIKDGRQRHKLNLKQEFYIAPEESCVSTSARDGKLIVSYRMHDNIDESHEIGEITVLGDALGWHFQGEPVVKIALNPEQQVFPYISNLFAEIPGPYIFVQHKSARYYHYESGHIKKMLLILNPGNYTLMGVNEGEIVLLD